MRVVRIITKPADKCNSFSTKPAQAPPLVRYESEPRPVLRSNASGRQFFWGSNENASHGALGGCVSRRRGLASSATPGANSGRSGSGSRALSRSRARPGAMPTCKASGTTARSRRWSAGPSSAIARTTRMRRSRSSKAAPRGAWSSRPTRTRRPISCTPNTSPTPAATSTSRAGHR